LPNRFDGFLFQAEAQALSHCDVAGGTVGFHDEGQDDFTVELCFAGFIGVFRRGTKYRLRRRHGFGCRIDRVPFACARASTVSTTISAADPTTATRTEAGSTTTAPADAISKIAGGADQAGQRIAVVRVGVRGSDPLGRDVELRGDGERRPFRRGRGSVVPHDRFGQGRGHGRFEGAADTTTTAAVLWFHDLHRMSNRRRRNQHGDPRDQLNGRRAGADGPRQTHHADVQQYRQNAGIAIDAIEPPKRVSRQVAFRDRLRGQFERRQLFRMQRFKDIREDGSVPGQAGIRGEQTIQVIARLKSSEFCDHGRYLLDNFASVC
jgi:hypothetical protein